MTDFQINDHILAKECEGLARDIFDDIMTEAADDETAEQLRDDMSDRVSESVDGHEWVIYNYKALMACAHCNVDEGEAFLEDVGMPETPTIYSLASLILYGEMRARIDSKINDMVEAWEPAEVTEAA